MIILTTTIIGNTNLGITTMQKLLNKIVLITGASSGIGLQCAKLFASLGARIILCARRVDKLEALAQELSNQFHTDYLILPLDVRDKEAVRNRLEALPDAWKAIDILVNNAGLALDTLTLQEGIVDHWDTMIDTNVKGLLYVTRAVMPGMVERDCGHIINIGSIAGHACYPLGNVYVATKHAVHALSKSMRLDMLGSTVRVTEIAPGAVETEFSEVRWNDKQRAKEFYEGFAPLTAEDIADAVVYCATRPKHVDIEEMIIMPTAQASVNFISKKKKP